MQELIECISKYEIKVQNLQKRNVPDLVQVKLYRQHLWHTFHYHQSQPSVSKHKQKSYINYAGSEIKGGTEEKNAPY